MQRSLREISGNVSGLIHEVCGRSWLWNAASPIPHPPARNHFPCSTRSVKFCRHALPSSLAPSVLRSPAANSVSSPRQPIDLGIAHQQHHAYEKLLASLGARSFPPAEPELPDSMLSKIPLWCWMKLAVIFLSARNAPSRSRDHRSRAGAFFASLLTSSFPDDRGGDILRVGRKLFVGLTARTNADGISQLAASRPTRLRSGFRSGERMPSPEISCYLAR